jgi:predicted DNA-binding protein (UPF0251 family)/predicted Fe-Mo cluster-binding NifX family protein
MNSRKKRYARRLDSNRIYKPVGVSRNVESNVLNLDEFEALRLVDYQGLSQIDASKEMQVSRATLQRLLDKARKKIIDSLLNNKPIEVHNEISNIKLKGENSFDIEGKEIKIIAFPTIDKVLIDSHFGRTNQFAIYSVKDNEILGVDYVIPPPHKPGVIPEFLKNKGVDVVITGNMGQRAIALFETHNIDVILGANGKIDVNLSEYLGGFLTSTGSVCEHESYGIGNDQGSMFGHGRNRGNGRY